MFVRYFLGHIRDSCQCRDLYVSVKASLRFIRPSVLADPAVLKTLFGIRIKCTVIHISDLDNTNSLISKLSCFYTCLALDLVFVWYLTGLCECRNLCVSVEISVDLENLTF